MKEEKGDNDEMFFVLITAGGFFIKVVNSKSRISYFSFQKYLE